MTSNSLKSRLVKIFEEYLQTSRLMIGVVTSTNIIVAESKKVVELMLKTNERLDQHERVLSTLLELYNEREKKEKEKYISLIDTGSKEKPQKPN